MPRKTLSEEVALLIAEEIYLGRYEDKEKMPIETELMKRFAVGRSTIREATKLLNNAGLVRSRQGLGTFVERGMECNSFLFPTFSEIKGLLMIQQQTLAHYAKPAADTSGYDHLNGGFFAAVHLEEFSAEKVASTAVYSRKDFYKISLITGDATYHYLDKSHEVRPGDCVLVFTNRETPYRWEIHSGACNGYSCMFTEDFLPLHTYVRPADLTVFNDAGYAVLRIGQQDRAVFEELFQKMIAEQASGYAHKYQLLFLYVLEFIHMAMKLAPEREGRSQTATSRLAEAFKLLLNDQFPLVNPFQEMALRSPQAFADKLAVHVNYLNRALKEVTGKTTTQLITERIMQEARALLLHSDWSISQISDSLGFDEPTHFTKAFKKATGELPSVVRQMV